MLPLPFENQKPAWVVGEGWGAWAAGFSCSSPSGSPETHGLPWTILVICTEPVLNMPLWNNQINDCVLSGLVPSFCACE